MEFLIKILMCAAIVWFLHEVEQVDALINYKRLSNFLKNVKRATVVYVILRLISAFLELWLGMLVGYFSLFSSAVFFVSLSLIIHFRREKLAQEWENVPEDNPEIYNEIITTIEDTKKELNKLK